MSIISDSLRRSNANIQSINSSLNSTKRSISSVNDSVDNISKIIATNTRIKSDLFSKSQLINSRREEASRRREQEDKLESSKVSTNTRSGLSFANRSDQGPLSRILGFLGFTFAGWVVENLPTWIFMGQEFVSRIQTFGRSMYNMVDDMKSIINSFGKTMGYAFESLVHLDFEEFAGEGIVAKSFEELNNSIKDLGANITDNYKLITTPLTESLTTGETAPPLDEIREPSLFPEEGQQYPRTVTGIHKKALDIISGPESDGNYNAMNQGTIGGRIVGSTMGGKTSKDIIGKELTSMTIGEIMKRQAYIMDKRNPQVSNYGIFAAGKYQIIPGTFETAVKNAGLKSTDIFSPENQDKLGLAVLKDQGIRAWTSGGSRYSAKQREIIEKARRTPVTYSPNLSSGQQNPTTLSTTPTQNQKLDLNRLGFSIGERAGFSQKRGKIHPGRDIAIDSGTPVSAITDATITDVGMEGGYGYFVAYLDSNGIEHFYAHLKELPKVRKGQKVSAGTIIGHVGSTGRSTGPHLHWEVSPRIGEVGRQRRNIIDPIEYGFPASAPFNGSKAQITPPPQRQDKLSDLKKERVGSQIIFIDDTQPQVSQPVYVSESTQTPAIEIHESKLLNNFIKNKLLLDLAYL